MVMPKLTLYHCPGACSRVSLNAFEEAGLDFEDRVVNVFAGEQNSDAYRSINPRGKVPALTVGDQLITENAAVLIFAHASEKGGCLLPGSEAAVDRARHYSDLIWCSSTLHPAVRQVRMPMRFTTGDTSGVIDRGKEYLETWLSDLEQHFSTQPYWYGDAWSIIDVYLYWCYSTASGSGVLPLDSCSAIQMHAERVRDRPSYKRALQRELEGIERSGMELPGGVVLS
jgi:glutathione S-transferase